ncbi:large ribosomal subunit protein mL46-like [Ptychodera flava]|uniref:large ribosomal subunit protein mL46-like n=1 Tax=Ptychodera flava TaxID=63121 RepID=UPI00396A5310
MWKAAKPLAISCSRVLQRYWKPCRACQQARQVRFYCASTKQSWQLMSAVCLERYPVVTRELTDIEQRYQDLLDTMELEKSVLSDHEVQLIQDKERMARMQSVDYDSDEEGDAGTSEVLTAADLEDLATEELNKFTTASRITDADKLNDTKSLQRQLTEKLYLLIKCKIGKRSIWMMPQGKRDEGESMKQAAERILTSTCGDAVNARFTSNAPNGFFKYKFPKEVRDDENLTGAKVFFYRARLAAGDISYCDDTIEDHVWVSSQELKDYLSPQYLESVNKFLME